MKVLHVTPYMHPSAGGPPVVVERLAGHAPENGWTASIITTSEFCEDGGRTLEAALRQRLDVTVLPVDRPKLLGLGPRASGMIDDAVRRADAVHVHTLWHPLNTAARQACTRHGRPYVLAPHGMLDPYSLGVKALKKRLYLALREGSNLRAAARLMFTTPLEEQLARASLPWLAGGEVIPLGADAPPLVPRERLAAAFEARFPQANGRRRLIALGRIHPKKGLDRILAALPAAATVFPDVLLIVAGSGEPDYLAELQHMAERNGVSQHVLFTGLLQGENKWGALAASEAFLLPSHQENFAIAVAEAMHMGLPVVISGKVNLWPFVREAGAGAVLGEDNLVQELEKAIIGLLSEPEDARGMGRRGQAFAAEHFDWRQTARLTCETYERVLGERAAGPA